MSAEPGARRVYTVTQVNRHVKELLADDYALSGLWVSGEISNYKPHSTGHRYFTLKDAGGAISAVMFASDAASLSFEPENGQQVEVLGSVSLYEKTGQYQIYIRRMQPQGRGSLYQAYEALKARLSAEGLFDVARKKPIPKYPRKVGIVTSPTGAAGRDIIQIARRRFPGVSLMLYPALVQGDGAAATVAEGIRRLDREPEVDVIVIGRGGGSIEDLWAFNEECVARAIYACETPLISAVGHETDFTIADFAADLRAPTPSAAAELAVPDAAQLLAALGAEREALGRSLRRKLSEERLLLGAALGRIKAGSPAARVAEARMQSAHLKDRLDRASRYFLKEKRHELGLSLERIKLLDPEAPLEKGYALVTDGAGIPVPGVKGLAKGDALTVRMKDGSAFVTVDAVNTISENENG